MRCFLVWNAGKERKKREGFERWHGHFILFGFRFNVYLFSNIHIIYIRDVIYHGII